eukprot:CAMPEP_0177764202 /NCGR_PEP_ID=MMETSP0491_2-20121128/7275_1 /TAXON_ID=63592 /ORGANISM="Tetraselmis chuii, Strain PLY429" /LENGTH=168 /DNA_ID=CAMNT_0019280353 /DNA_START=515 /DNA_END=1018 /DNA_ORIENTATION=-
MSSPTSDDVLRLLDDPVFWKKQERELGSQELWQRLAKAQGLPTLSSPEKVKLGLDTPEIWAISETVLGNDVHAITVRISHRGAFHDRKMVMGKVNMCRGAPTSEFVINAITSAMTDPLTEEETGPPHRPTQLLVANKMSSCFGAVSAAMEPVDVPCKLASEAETQAFG